MLSQDSDLSRKNERPSPGKVLPEPKVQVSDEKNMPALVSLSQCVVISLGRDLLIDWLCSGVTGSGQKL